MTRNGKSIVCGLSLCAILAGPALAADEPAAGKAKNPTAAARKGPAIMLGTQAYTFRLFTLFEAIDKAHELGLRYIEAFPGQTLSKESGDVKIDQNLSPELIAKLKAHLKEKQVNMKGFGVVTFKKDTSEADYRKIFKFAKELGVVTITAEPDEEILPLVDKLANEYEINIAIHNHPKPSHYWNPETLLNAIKGRSPRIGSCADTGHWARSGLDPVTCLKQLKGHILWLHFKDLNEMSPEAHDSIWGTGKCNAKEMLTVLRQQGFKGGLMVEYEHNWENSMPDIAKCIEFYKATMKELRGAAKAANEKP